MLVSRGRQLGVKLWTLSRIENMQISVHRVSCGGESQGAGCKKGNKKEAECCVTN